MFIGEIRKYMGIEKIVSNLCKNEKIANYILATHKRICEYGTNRSAIFKKFENAYWLNYIAHL